MTFATISYCHSAWKSKCLKGFRLILLITGKSYNAVQGDMSFPWIWRPLTKSPCYLLSSPSSAWVSIALQLWCHPFSQDFMASQFKINHIATMLPEVLKFSYYIIFSLGFFVFCFFCRKSLMWREGGKDKDEVRDGAFREKSTRSRKQNK